MIGQFMAKVVIEQLETIEVDVQQGQIARTLAHALAGLLQALLEQGTIGQAGQLIKLAKVAHPRLHHTPLLHFAGQFGVQLLASVIGLLQVGEQALLLQAPRLAPLFDPVELPTQTTRQQKKADTHAEKNTRRI